MTDRHAGYIVVLDGDLREDDAEALASAIRQLRGVISVEPVQGGPEIAIAEARARRELCERLFGVLGSK